MIHGTSTKSVFCFQDIFVPATIIIRVLLVCMFLDFPTSSELFVRTSHTHA